MKITYLNSQRDGKFNYVDQNLEINFHQKFWPKNFKNEFASEMSKSL